MAKPIENVLSAVASKGGQPKRNAHGWEARCPAHDDQHASLSVSATNEGKVLVRCHAGCSFKDIVAALGLRSAAFFPDNSNRKGRIVAEFPYRNENGTVLFVVARFAPKKFRQYRLTGNPPEKVWSLDGCRRVPYRLPETLEAIKANRTIYIVEGEKDVESLVEWGLDATTCPQGAGKWRSEFNRHFRGARVVIVPDSDGPGQRHAHQVAKNLKTIAADVRILELPAKDTTDWIVNGGTKDELLRLASEARPAATWITEQEAADVNRQEFHLTDTGNAMRLVAAHGDDLRYCHPWARWFAWDGRRWPEDLSGEIQRRAQETVRGIYTEAQNAATEATRKDLASHAMKCESESKRNAMVSLARSEPGIPVLPEEFDRDPWLLNCENGTLDLRTGKLRPHGRDDLITALAPVEYDPQADAPTWRAFLNHVMDGNAALIEFLGRAVGYSLTGDTTERIVFLLYGTGANGKTVFLESIRAMLGPEYSRRTPTETLLARRGTDIPNDVARLRGARLVSASESDEGRRLAESRIKDLTGGDTITARFMRAEFFEFRPEFKLWLATNHKPTVRGTDEGIWDRIRLIPFTVRIPEPERDKQLLDKLRDELPGILAWAGKGCRAWQKDGLSVPPEVRQATGAYRAEQDVLGAFLDERCVLQDNAQATAGDLFKMYREWAEAAGERAVSRTRFGLQLAERGLTKSRGHGGRTVWKGVGLLDG